MTLTTALSAGLSCDNSVGCSRSVDDGNIFNQGIHDSCCQNILCNYLKNLEISVTETFYMVNTAKENHPEVAKQLNNPTDAVGLIKRKFEKNERERRKKDKVIKALQGQVLTLHNHSENLETKVDRQKQ